VSELVDRTYRSCVVLLHLLKCVFVIVLYCSQAQRLKNQLLQVQQEYQKAKEDLIAYVRSERCDHTRGLTKDFGLC